MKPILFALLFSFVGSTAYGQDTIYHFHVLQEELVWQHVFQTSLSFEELTQQCKDAGLLSDIEITQDKLSGALKPIDADFKGAGFSEMATPIYIARSHISGFAVLEYREGRYRVTLRKIFLTQRYTDPLSHQGELTHLETYGLNSKKEITGMFKKSPSLILDYTFSKKFDFNTTNPQSKW